MPRRKWDDIGLPNVPWPQRLLIALLIVGVCVGLVYGTCALVM